MGEEQGEKCHGKVVGKWARVDKTLSECVDVVSHINVVEEAFTTETFIHDQGYVTEE